MNRALVYKPGVSWRMWLEAIFVRLVVARSKHQEETRVPARRRGSVISIAPLEPVFVSPSQ